MRNLGLFKDVILEDAWKILDTQNIDGSWPGLKYGLQGHCPIDHLRNIRKLAGAFAVESDAARKTALKRGVMLGLIFWFENQSHFVSDNWWMNEIGVQRELNPIALFMWEHLPNDIRKKLIEVNPVEVSRNGANRTWIAENVAYRGILSKDETMLSIALENIAKTMTMTNQEGHQADHSFFMHGSQLYNGGYGKMALSIAARWAVAARDTKFEFSPEVIYSMSALALEGNRWMMWNGMVDPMVLGREISRTDGNKLSMGHRAVVKNLNFQKI